MKKSILYKLLSKFSFLFVILLLMSACDDDEVREWYYEEPPIPANARIFGEESFNVGIDESAEFFVKLKGTPPFDLVYNDGEEDYKITGIEERDYSISVKPDVTTKYILKSVSNVVGEGSLEEGEAIVKVLSIKEILSPVLDTYAQANEAGKGKDHSEDKLLLLKNATDGYARRIYMSFDLTDIQVGASDEFYFKFFTVFSNVKAKNAYVIEATEGLVSPSLDWGTQPEDDSFVLIKEKEPKDYLEDKVAETLIESVDTDVTKFVQDLLAEGKTQFSIRIKLKDTNSCYLKIASNENENEEFRPTLSIKGQILKAE